MKQIVSTLLTGGLALGAPAHVEDKKPQGKDAPVQTVLISPTLEVSRVVKYTDRDVVSVKAKVRYTTMIILPKEERILDFVCGDKNFWVVNGSVNFAYVKPAKEK